MQKAAHSTKLSKKYFFEDDKLIIKKTFDASHVLNDVKQARELTENSFGSDHKHAGYVDVAQLGIWLKEAGVAWTDTEAVKDVVKRKLMSGEFSALRVWEGSW